MDEFIREVDEEYRREQIARIWSRFGGLIVAAAILLVAAVGGWRYWQHRQGQMAEAAGLRFEDAVVAARDGKPDEAEALLKPLATGDAAGYRLLARFRLAAETGRTDPAGGAAGFDALAADTAIDGSVRDLARLRAATLRIGTAEPGDAAAQLQGLAAPGSAWRHSAREILGLDALRRGDYDAAGRWFDQMAADRETPPNLRGRLEIYTALVAGGPVQTTTSTQ